MTKLAFTLGSNFFSESSEDYRASLQLKLLENDSIDLITQSFGELHFELTHFDNKSIVFTPEDEVEIARGESYRGSKNLPKNLTLAKFRKFLSQNKITNEETQNLILHMLLQHHLGINVALGKIVVALLVYIHPALGIKAKDYTVRFEFTTDDAIEIYLYIPVTGAKRIDNDMPQVGMASVCFTVAANNQITMSPLIIALEETDSFSLQPIRDAIVNKTTNNFLKPLNIKSSVSNKELSQEINSLLEAKLVEQPKPTDFLYENRKWMGLAAFGLLSIIGMALTLSGVFSPAGILILLGANLPVLGSLAIDLGVYLILNAILGTILTKVMVVFSPESPVLVAPENPVASDESIDIYHITPTIIETQAQQFEQKIKLITEEIKNRTILATTEDNMNSSDEKSKYIPFYPESQLKENIQVSTKNILPGLVINEGSS